MVDGMIRKASIKTHRLFFLPALLALLIVFLSVGAFHVVQAAQLSKKTVVLYQGQTKKLKVSASGAAVWSSTNTKVASVTSGGKVRALTAGTCRIQATVGSAVYSCKVRVKALAFTNPVSSMVRGRQHELELNCKKAKNAIWTSSKPKVAEVRNGIVQAKTPGTTVITARWRNISVRCTIKVTNISPELLSAAYPVTKQNKGKILLAGSSSMDFWDSAAQAFSPYEIINTAIGGTTVVQWLNWYKLLITRYKPCAVVLYVGSNDLSNGEGVSGQKNAENTILLLKRITKKLKKTPVFYVSVNPCWARKGGWQEIAVSNKLVRKYCQKKKNLYYIDITQDFSGAGGTPKRELFLPDQLHPSTQGYKIWMKRVAKLVKKTVKKRSR